MSKGSSSLSPLFLIRPCTDTALFKSTSENTTHQIMCLDKRAGWRCRLARSRTRAMTAPVHSQVTWCRPLSAVRELAQDSDQGPGSILSINNTLSTTAVMTLGKWRNPCPPGPVNWEAKYWRQRSSLGRWWDNARWQTSVSVNPKL